MITIEMPRSLLDMFWHEYIQLDYHNSGFKSLREYLNFKIRVANVTGTIFRGYILEFADEHAYLMFKLAYSDYELSS